MKHTGALLAAVAITIALQSAADCQQRSPAAAQSEIDMAEKAVAAKDYIGAAEHLDKARQRTPFSPGIPFNQAVAEARAGGRDQRAIVLFNAYLAAGSPCPHDASPVAGDVEL